jgi:16S rRNA (uracil1498-N3)-methyltransferase
MRCHRFPVQETAAVGAKATLTGTDAKHIRIVLRLRPGDKVWLFDGSGAEFEAKIESFEADRVIVAVLGAAAPHRESPVRIVAGQAILKEKKMDRIVRQITELGIDTWIPFPADRTVARPSPGKMAARVDRWRRIAAEAAKQSRRLKRPEIVPAADFNGAIARAEGCDVKILFWEQAPIEAGWPAPSETVRSVFLLVGPEGGLTNEEVDRARFSGFWPASLGPRILRAETAAVAVCALAQHRYGDLGGHREGNGG